MPTPLSPAEQVAQSMLLLHRKSPAIALEALSAMSQAVARVYENNPEPSPAELDAATLSAVRNLGYDTDLDSIGRQVDYLLNHHAGYWSGNYTLVDARNGVHRLLVNETQVRLLLDGTDEALAVPSEGGAFAGRRLRVDNDKVTVDLAFSSSTDDIDVTAPDVDLAEASRRARIRVAGTLTVKGAGVAAGTHSVQGARGVATPAGVYHDYGGEPVDIWVGDYRLRYTDTTAWEFLDHELRIALDPQTRALSVRLGATEGRDVVCTNGIIRFVFDASAGVTTQVTMEMHATSAGSRMCYLWFETTGQMRTLTGYALDMLDAATLWKGAPAPAMAAATAVEARRAARATAAKRDAAAKTRGAAVEDFFLTPFDATFSIASVAPDATATGTKGPADLFMGDTLTLVDASTVSGFLAREVDVGGMPASGRVALFTYAKPEDGGADTGATVNGNRFPGKVKLKAYQQLDEGRHWQFGLENTLVGVLAPEGYELPEAVETESYEVRLSLLDYDKLRTDGLRIDFAIDDALQKTLVALDPPRAYDPTKDAFDWTAYTGPAAEVVTAVPDFTRASTLVRSTAGETQVTGHKTYYFAIRPKTFDGFFQVTRTLYEPSATDPHRYQQVGAPTIIDVPVLLRFPLEMSSVSEIQLTNAVWVPATRGKDYSARIQVLQGGKQPFVWGLVNAGDISTYTPPDLEWDVVGKTGSAVGKDIQSKGMVSFGLAGTVATGAGPGTVYSPAIRVRSAPTVVMNVTKVNPQIVITEPELAGKVALEIFLAIVAGIELLGLVIAALTFWYYRKEVKAGLPPKADDVIALLPLESKDVNTMASDSKEMLSNPSEHDQRAKKKKLIVDNLEDLAADHKKATDALNDMGGRTNENAEKYDALEDFISKTKEQIDRMNGEHNTIDVDSDTSDDFRKSEKK